MIHRCRWGSWWSSRRSHTGDCGDHLLQSTAKLGNTGGKVPQGQHNFIKPSHGCQHERLVLTKPVATCRSLRGPLWPDYSVRFESLYLDPKKVQRQECSLKVLMKTKKRKKLTGGGWRGLAGDGIRRSQESCTKKEKMLVS